MSYPDYTRGRGPQRWFDGGPRRLRGLLMTGAALIAGMFLGRYLTQSETDSTIALLESELSDRDLEIGMLRHEALQPPPQQQALDRLAEQHEVLLRKYQQLTARLDDVHQAAMERQRRIGQVLKALDQDQHQCLAELQQIEQLLPVDNVRRFAESLYNARRQELESLAADQVSPEPVPAAPVLLSGRRPESDRDAGIASAASSDADRESNRGTGTFFGPLPKRRTGYTYCTPSAHTRVTDAPRSRIVFSDNRDDASGPVRR